MRRKPRRGSLWTAATILAVAASVALAPAGLAGKPTTKPNDKQKPIASEKSWVKLGGGKAYGTYLSLDAGLASALTGLGVEVKLRRPATDPSDSPDKGIRFPITQGKLVLATSGQPPVLSSIRGTIGHVGGLTLVQGTKVVRVRNLVIVVDTAGVSKVTAQVNGKRIWFATPTSLGLPAVVGKTVTVDDVQLSLSDTAAAALNAAFGTSALSASTKVGTAAVKARLVGSGKTKT